MIDYTVISGDCLSSIAAHFRLSSWKVIYDHPDNAAFKQKRPNPNIIYPGDLLKIPVDDTRTESVSTNQKYKFKLVAEKVKLVLYMKDDAGKGLSGRKYKLEVGGVVKEGKTPSDGKILAEVPATAKSGSLRVWISQNDKDAPAIFPLQIGDLDPIEEVSGVKARLANLGYSPGTIDDAVNDQYTAAIKQFQAKNSLDPANGTLNDDTRSKLKEKHGS